MRYVILLAVLAVATCAPLENEAIRVRRAQEIVMFENEQNESKDKVKRADEDVDVDDSTIDTQGEIISQEPQDLEPAEPDIASDELDDSAETVESVDDAVGDLEAPEEVGNEVMGDVMEPEEEEVINPDATEMDMSPAEEDGLVENEGEVINGDEDAALDFYNGVIGIVRLPAYIRVLFAGVIGIVRLPAYNPDQQQQQQLPSYYYDLLTANRGAPSAPSSFGYNDMYRLPFLRRRRSQERIFLGDKARARILKRSHRIKRDLIDPSEYMYEYGDEYPEESGSRYNELVGYLLDILDDRYNEEPAYETPYETPYGYDDAMGLEPYEEIEEPVEELVYPGYEERLLENAVAKRQAGLTFVPGFKRSNFFPYFKEPQGHFSGLVPEKRSQEEEYASAYKRVMGLAAALGQRDYYPMAYDQDYDFRRK